jgi:hypothetical protein
MLAVNQHPDRLDITWEGRPLCTYVLRDDDPPHLFRRPYLHPVYTLDGDLVTDCRPADHPWHKGISMTMSVVDDQNFWGGPTYRDGQYVQLDNVGEVRHEGWKMVDTWESGFVAEQQLSWMSAQGEKWFHERRNIDINVVSETDPFWTLDWIMHFENVSGRTLRLGSPATEGRAGAGYTGLFWRGAPEFQQAVAGDDFSESIDFPPDDFNGSMADYVALRYPGYNQPPLMSISFFKSSADTFPIRWFVRAQEYPGVAFSFAFDKAVEVAPGEYFSLRHSIYVRGIPPIPPWVYAKHDEDS